MPCIRIPKGVLTFTGEYQPGDQPPTGYIDWVEWAETQHKAGLRQAQCGKCGLWGYPQELSHVVMENEVKDGRGRTMVLRSRVCNECTKKK